MGEKTDLTHMENMTKDFACGTFAGVFQTFTGHPFDSLKVRMQTAKVKLTLTQTIIKVNSEGIFGFYRGLTPPLCTIPIVNAIVMSSYELCKRFMGVENENDFTFKQSIISGMFAGFVNSFVISPVELVKCRLQIQTQKRKANYYKGPIDCSIKVVKEEGLSTLLTSGLITTILRETC